jgi:hypothetical protein
MHTESERKRSLGIYRCRWEANNRMEFREIGWNVVDWIPLALDSYQWWAVVNTVINPSIKGGQFLD